MSANLTTMDLNLDAGESAAGLEDGSESLLYGLVTSVNVACGGHAGDESTMAKSIELALEKDLRIGAHPSFPDRENFGRVNMSISKEVLSDALVLQIESLIKVANQFGAPIKHVKPHGALYNLAAQDMDTALAVLTAVHWVNPKLVVIGLAGSPFLQWCRDSGLATMGEAFADRRYEPNGQLRARKNSDALITDPESAADQALQIAKEKKVISVEGTEVGIKAQTLCIHADTPNAFEVAKSVRGRLEQNGVLVQAPGRAYSNRATISRTPQT